MEEFAWVRTMLAVSIHVVLLLVAAWDLTAAARGHGELSVSAIVQAWSLHNPILPLVVGVLLGHLFWPIR